MYEQNVFILGILLLNVVMDESKPNSSQRFHSIDFFNLYKLHNHYIFTAYFHL